MDIKSHGCLICGSPLHYCETEQPMTCSICGKTYPSRTACAAGHFVCDTCHADPGTQRALARCRNSASKDPVALLQEMMDDPLIHMHGGEHHVLVGAALLTAYRNAGGAVDLDAALNELRTRGRSYPGGSCGFWGCCGAAVSAGMFLSVLSGTTPLSTESWGQANQITAQALSQIAALGGPRCCKRNSFTAVKAAAAFVQEHLGVAMDLPDEIVCHYAAHNKECIGQRCPYHDKSR